MELKKFLVKRPAIRFFTSAGKNDHLDNHKCGNQGLTAFLAGSLNSLSAKIAGHPTYVAAGRLSARPSSPWKKKARPL
jgi:hypothetical protein